MLVVSSEVLAPISDIQESVVPQEVRDEISEYQRWKSNDSDDPMDYIEDSDYLTAMRDVLEFGSKMDSFVFDVKNRAPIKRYIDDLNYYFKSLEKVSSFDTISWPESFEKAVNALLSAFYASVLLSKAAPKKPEEETEDI